MYSKIKVKLRGKVTGIKLTYENGVELTYVYGNYLWFLMVVDKN
jgi:hypothetical protein